MDITSLYYFRELSKDFHMTHTAKRLFISQQTLSNRIKCLEDSCGTPLFYRKPKLRLTTAGEAVLDFAIKVLREKKNLDDIISEIKEEERGVIKFGASSLRVNKLLPNILPEFSKHYPNIEIRITNETSNKLEPLIENGILDIANVVSYIPNKEIISMPLMKDQVYLCVSENLLKKYYFEDMDFLLSHCQYKADITDFSKIPLCMLSNKLGQKVNDCFLVAGIKPKIYATTSSVNTGTLIGITGVAGFFATKTSLINQKETLPLDLKIFPLFINNQPFYQEVFLIYHKDRYMTHYAKHFIMLLENYYSKMENTSL
ncbi:MAG: LysR family transcriptional regulator [Lachnospiraceae bacterium]|jgi:DNA-binding transcriptional LysR family regulator|nr:LysR family transcriptional regulator [Lachnospiraceae bacterium]